MWVGERSWERLSALIAGGGKGAAIGAVTGAGAGAGDGDHHSG